MSAALDWATMLLDWAIPEKILAAAPANPYAFPDIVITQPTVDPLTTPTGQVVGERLASGERLLDVGCGAGRISGAFATDHEVVGVEPRSNLAATARRVGLTVHEGRWPDAAAAAGRAPVVLTTHVLYDVADAVDFLQALHAAATRRVVLEVTATHPWSRTTPLFRHFHGLDRPDGPTVDLLVRMIVEVLGVHPTIQRWTRPRARYPSLAALAADHRRMLCLGPEADDEVADLLRPDVLVAADGRVSLPDQDLATLHWDTDGTPVDSTATDAATDDTP